MKIDKEATQTFGCCSGTDDISVENSISDMDIVEIDRHSPTVNIQKFVMQQEAVDFPKRMSMDVQFQDLKYTVGKFSFRNRKYGKFMKMNNSIGKC